MSTFDTVERPAGSSSRRWAFDVVVAAFAAASALPNLIHSYNDIGGHPHASEVLTIVVLAAPLVVRRRWPVEVFSWLFIAGAVTLLVDEHVVVGGALLIGLFTVASRKPRRTTLTAALLLELGVLLFLVTKGQSDWWSNAIFLSGLLAAAVGLGLYFATRRAYLDELHDRAERLERERDQQGALAAAAERDRIAREMHDIVAHHLTVMVALSDGAIAASAASPERAVEVMRSVSATGRRALADTRRLLGVLRTTSDEDPDFRQPIPDLAELDILIDRVRTAGLATTLEVQGAATELPAGVQLTVYRLVQEALTNTLKHGGAEAHAKVRLRYLPGTVLVNIDDDGAGAAAPLPVGVGGGLAGMRERVHAYGGDVQAGPRQPAGWSVAARLYLDENEIS